MSVTTSSTISGQVCPPTSSGIGHLLIDTNPLITAGVLGNLTSLEVLDISGNALTDEKIMGERRFGVLRNLTVFRLAHNKFTELPIELLTEHKKLRTLDVGYNQLKHYYPELSEQVKLRLDVFYEGTA